MPSEHALPTCRPTCLPTRVCIRQVDENMLGSWYAGEVVDHELKKSGSVWVQPSENYVLTRFFFVFTHGFTDGYRVELKNESYRADLNRVAAQF